MNTPTKSQDGDGHGPAANGSVAPLEQTFLGVAPPAAPAPRPSPDDSPVAPVAPASSPHPGEVAASAQPPVAPGTGREGVLAAPTIAIADAGPAVATAPLSPQPTQTAPGAASSLEQTLPVGASRPSAGSPAQAVPGAPRPAPPALEPQLRTALSDDYLRAARDAALSALAGTPPAPSAPAASAPFVPAPGALPLTPMATTLPAGASGPAPTDAWGGGEASAIAGQTRPSIAPPPGPDWPPPSPPGAASTTGRSVRPAGFEPVPAVRAPLAESLSGGLGLELGGSRTSFPPPSLHPPAPARGRAEAAGRWLLLGSVALATVGVVSLGTRLWDRYRESPARQRALVTAAPSDLRGASPARAALPLMAGPSSRDLAEGPVKLVSATNAPTANAAAPSGGASPETQLAATAARHVLSGSYAEALPIYRQLERTYPASSAYGAMARLLEKKIGTSSDTPSVAPAPVSAPRPR